MKWQIEWFNMELRLSTTLLMNCIIFWSFGLLYSRLTLTSQLGKIPFAQDQTLPIGKARKPNMYACTPTTSGGTETKADTAVVCGADIAKKEKIAFRLF
jgi:hypothetical protein